MRISIQGDIDQSGTVELLIGGEHGIAVSVTKEQVMKLLFGGGVPVPAQTNGHVSAAPTRSNLRREAGLCSMCDKKPAPGKRVCATHLKLLQARMVKVRAKKNKKV